MTSSTSPFSCSIAIISLAPHEPQSTMAVMNGESQQFTPDGTNRGQVVALRCFPWTTRAKMLNSPNFLKGDICSIPFPHTTFKNCTWKRSPKIAKRTCHNIGMVVNMGHNLWTKSRTQAEIRSKMQNHQLFLADICINSQNSGRRKEHRNTNVKCPFEFLFHGSCFPGSSWVPGSFIASSLSKLCFKTDHKLSSQ